MDFENLFELKTIIKFVVLGIGFIVLVFVSTDVWKWRIIFSLGGLMGLVIALSGSTLGRDHSLGGGRR